MLIRQLFQGKDYRATLHRRLCLSLAITLLGTIAVIISRTVLTEGNNLRDFIEGLYFGAGSSIYFGLTIEELFQFDDEDGQ